MGLFSDLFGFDLFADAAPRAKTIVTGVRIGERDPALEAALDEVGREAAFALASANGWSAGDAPPKWVWWDIIAQLRQEATSASREAPPAR